MAVLQVKQRIAGTANSSVFVVEEVGRGNQQPAKRNNYRLAPAMYINMPDDNNSKPAGQ